MPRMRILLTILGLLGLVLAVKLTLVLSLADVFFYGEELEKGAAAKAMIDGLSVPHYMLAYHYYEGGGFTISHLTALAFMLVGENLWAHKLVSLGFNLAIALAGISFLRRNFGMAAGVSFGLLYAFAPLVFQKLSLLNLGIHYESSLFLLLIFHFGTRLLCDEKPSRGCVIALGLAIGFGCYFNFGMLPLAAFWVGLLLLFRRSSITGGREFILGWSVLIGATPLLLMWCAVGNEVFNIHGTQFFSGNEGSGMVAGMLDPIRTFFSSLIERASAFQRVLLALWVAVPIAGLRLSLQLRGGRAFRAYLALLAYLGCFAVVYVASPFVIGDAYHYFLYQRLTPFWILGACLCAATIGTMISGTRISVDDSAKRTGFRIGGLALLAVFVGGGMTATMQAVRTGTGRSLSENSELLRSTKGYTYAEYFAKLIPHLPGSHESSLRTLLEFEEPQRSLLYADAAAALYDRSDLSTEEILATFQSVDREHKRELMLGLGPYLYFRASGRMRLALQQASKLPDRLADIYLEALGRRGLYIYRRPEKLVQELAEWGSNPPPGAYYRGFGHRVSVAFRLDPDAAQDFISTLSEPMRGLVREGYEAARLEHSLAPTTTGRDS